jgi:hypothetical protein
MAGRTLSGLGEQTSSFDIIGRFSVNANWNGAPLVLMPSDNANMPQTPNGSMVFAYQNVSTMNNQGTLSTTTGSNPPQFLPAPALTNQPSILINNWQANNLSVTNVSPTGTNTPIVIQAYGPGIPGVTPLPLPPDGTNVQLGPGNTAQGNALPRYMQLVFQASTGNLTIYAVVGGPTDASGNNAFLISVNAAANTGPGTGYQPPTYYYSTTTGNSATYQFNWGSSTIFIANLSPSTSSAAAVVLRTL